MFNKKTKQIYINFFLFKIILSGSSNQVKNNFHNTDSIN